MSLEVDPSARVVHPRTRVAVTGALAAAALGLLTVLVVQRWEPLLSSDLRLDAAIHDWALRTPTAVDVASSLQKVGDPFPSTLVVLVTVVVLLLARRWWLALAVAAVGAFAPLATDLIKPAVDRPRPVWAAPIETAYQLQPSFPSGHATGGVAVWVVCGLALGSLLRDPTAGALLALPFVVLGFAIGLSRLVLGVHWPSDIVAGWMVALLATCLAGVLFLARDRAAPGASAAG